ncbi:hypothetical protein IU438_13130 [Nocardia cyriacigeorgica]|uniref:hypothetical protein n=1 Tax=Nocardia cyriacigeorgica TaxID=135487 RepID=UPI0018961478|nr:hypothetical protein [Nocardia cyriacigeorgica]MBF6396737.1 hypothetical protein [Nocardia cyriacigeorgica]MBF6402369.1 hypothetical protein [Nocardia cyriacigeorgica]
MAPRASLHALIVPVPTPGGQPADLHGSVEQIALRYATFRDIDRIDDQQRCRRHDADVGRGAGVAATAGGQQLDCAIRREQTRDRRLEPLVGLLPEDGFEAAAMNQWSAATDDIEHSVGDREPRA